MPQYLKKYNGHDMSVNLFGHNYDAPFGISPIGLQGLIWPNSPEILAKAALLHNIPYILSTVSSERNWSSGANGFTTASRESPAMP